MRQDTLGVDRSLLAQFGRYVRDRFLDYLAGVDRAMLNSPTMSPTKLPPSSTYEPDFILLDRDRDDAARDDGARDGDVTLALGSNIYDVEAMDERLEDAELDMLLAAYLIDAPVPNAPVASRPAPPDASPQCPPRSKR